VSYSREILLNSFRDIFRKATGVDFEKIEQLKADSSERKIYRLTSGDESYVAVHNENLEENAAYISFSKSFLNAGLLVPKVISVSDDNSSYLVEDLGDMTLFKYSSSVVKDSLHDLHSKALSDLVMFQTLGKTVIDFSKCFPSEIFDKTIILNDIEKFRKYFLKNIAGIELPQTKLENISDIFIRIVEKNCHDHFMYRDFQPRNIMLKESNLYYIDFQSGMKGPAQYDLVSFLYSGSIELDEEERMVLSKSYSSSFEYQTGITEDEFMNDLGEFVLLRMVQVLGSYSYVHHKKQIDDTLKKIPKAINNIALSVGKIKDPILKEFAERVTEIGTKIYS
jgi:aminoglycoside/choline kinase family phosphotransferase